MTKPDKHGALNMAGYSLTPRFVVVTFHTAM